MSGVREVWDLWRTLAERHGARLAIVQCVCPADVHRARVEARERGLHGISEVRWSDVEARRAEYLPWHEPRLVLDTSAGVEGNVRRAIAYLSMAA